MGKVVMNRIQNMSKYRFKTHTQSHMYKNVFHTGDTQGDTGDTGKTEKMHKRLRQVTHTITKNKHCMQYRCHTYSTTNIQHELAHRTNECREIQKNGKNGNTEVD